MAMIRHGGGGLSLYLGLANWGEALLRLRLRLRLWVRDCHLRTEALGGIAYLTIVRHLNLSRIVRVHRPVLRIPAPGVYCVRVLRGPA